MHIINESVKSLYATVEYPEDYRYTNTFYNNDIEYLKSRILTHRSINSSKVDPVTSQYYEGAKTLVELMDIVHRTGMVHRIFNVSITIDTSNDVKLPEASITFIMEPHHTTLCDTINIEEKPFIIMTLLYTTKIDNHCHYGNIVSKASLDEANDSGGMFLIAGRKASAKIVMIDSEPRIEFTPCSEIFTLGDTPIESLFDVVPDRLECFSQGTCYRTGSILKYSENFPTYSKLAEDITECIELVVNSNSNKTN